MNSKSLAIIAALTLCAAAAYTSDLMCNFTMQVDKGYLKWSRSVSTGVSITNAAPNVAGATQLIPTDAGGTALTLGNVATNGWAWFGNLSTTTNWVEIGIQESGTFYPLLRINAGEYVPVRLAQGITPYARANSSAVVLEKYIFDN